MLLLPLIVTTLALPGVIGQDPGLQIPDSPVVPDLVAGVGVADVVSTVQPVTTQLPALTRLPGLTCGTCAAESTASSVMASPSASAPSATLVGSVAAVGVGGLAWAFWAWAGRAASLFAIPNASLFSRLQKHDTANHPARARILEWVAANPSACLQDVRRASGLAWGTAHYHVRRLEDSGLLISRSVGGKHMLWCAGTQPAGLLRGISADAKGIDIARLVHMRPGIAQAEISTLSDLGLSAVCKRLQKLQQAGLLIGRRSGREVRYSPTEHLTQLLMTKASQAVGPITPTLVATTA